MFSFPLVSLVPPKWQTMLMKKIGKTFAFLINVHVLFVPGNKWKSKNHYVFLIQSILFSMVHFSMNSLTKELNDIFSLQACKSNNHRMEKVTIWRFNVLTKWSMNSPMIPVQITILSLFDNTTNKFLNLMLKQSLVIVDRNYKFFRRYCMFTKTLFT